MNWLPEHKCGLYLSHNEHSDVYETIERYYDHEDFISPDEWHEALAKNSVWVLQWYPETPIGFIRIAASTLEAIKEAVEEYEANLKEKNTTQEQSEEGRLRQVCRNVYEIWAGSEGIPVPETCAEGYLLRLIEQMRDEAKAGLGEEKNTKSL